MHLAPRLERTRSTATRSRISPSSCERAPAQGGAPVSDCRLPGEAVSSRRQPALRPLHGRPRTRVAAWAALALAGCAAAKPARQWVPAYPSVLRSAGYAGTTTVMVRVDRSGYPRVMPSGSSSDIGQHPLFLQAVSQAVSPTHVRSCPLPGRVLAGGLTIAEGDERSGDGALRAHY